MPIFTRIPLETLLEPTRLRGASSIDSNSSPDDDDIDDAPKEKNKNKPAPSPNISLLSVRLPDKSKDDDSDYDDDFFDPRDSLSVISSMDEVGTQTAVSSTTLSTEYYDANEDFFSSSHSSHYELELRATRFNLFEKIERRKAAEKALDHMYCQWQRLSSAVSEAGLTFPTPLHENDSMEQVFQELVVARFVSEAIGKGQARAEAEIAATAIIESKDLEISRLRNRLQYYETVSHEMSHWNQEVMEISRMHRQRKKSQRRWIWSCIGLSIAIGASVIANSYLPLISKGLAVTLNDSSDASTANSSESA